MNAPIKPEHLALRAHDSEDYNTSPNPSFNDVLDARLSRRNVLRVSMGTAGAALLGSLPLGACGGGSDAAVASGELKLSFPAVAKSLADTVAVPTGYTATVLYALGDPLSAARRSSRTMARTPATTTAPAIITTAWSTSA